jgi:preprotein translocase subunit SecY
VIPPIFASSLLLLPATLAGFSEGQRPGLDHHADGAARPWPAGCTWRSMRLIIFFAFFYTAIVFNPKDTADNLKQAWRFHPGHPSRRAHGGVHRLRADPDHGGWCLYLTIVCLIPEFLISYSAFRSISEVHRFSSSSR